MTRTLMLALALVVGAGCTPAQVDRWFDDVIGHDITQTEAISIAAWINSQDCLPGYAADQYTECAIADMAARFGVPLSWFARVAWCESRLDPTARNPTSSASGLFQFLASTWGWVADRTGHGDVFNARQNALNAAWLWTTHGSHHWSCA